MSASRKPDSPPPLGPRRIRALQRRMLDWYEDERRDLPWRRTVDPYAILVSEIMLQQTQVPRVVPKYASFLAAFPTLEALAAAPLADVLAEWRGLGYNNRAVRLRRCAAAVCAAAPGGAARAPAHLPRELPELRALPGLGPYTARAVLVFAHNADLAAVDANVRRVLTHELGLPHDLSPARLQAVADAVLPRGRSRDWHNALMDYGSAVLTSRATRIASRTRQGPFEGSRRWHRSQLLQRLLDGGPARPDELARDLRLPPAEVAELVGLLERDGLLRRRDGLVVVA
jgi:A/G-specific adenine glycosylase